MSYLERRCGGVCTRCGGTPARWSDGRPKCFCERCAEKRKVSYLRRPHDSERSNGVNRTRYHARRERGLCVECGKRPGEAARCVTCKTRVRARRLARRARP